MRYHRHYVSSPIKIVCMNFEQLYYLLCIILQLTVPGPAWESNHVLDVVDAQEILQHSIEAQTEPTMRG